MKTEQQRWTSETGWEIKSNNELGEKADLVFLFGGREPLADAARFDEVKSNYPNAKVISGSTAGEILDIEVTDDTVALTAVQFEQTELKYARLHIDEVNNSYEAGKKLADDLIGEGLAHIFVLSDGLKVNGSELVKGFNESLPEGVSVTGGLAGDAARFEKTLVGLDSAPSEGNVIAIGLYGDNIKVGHGSKGGWDPFGPEREVTRSSGNVLYEIDGQSALSLYKNYLGDKADGLPGTGLLFPLSLKEHATDSPVVRTLLAVDEEEQSMTFAGDIPKGSIVQLMKANFDKLIDASADAAEDTIKKLDTDANLAICISCVGRKLILGQRIEEEVEEVRAVLGDDTSITGFYSYGEISPLTPSVNCELHNQTMTITTFSEN